MAAPLVSVLLPVRNAAEFLPQCIASLGRQTLEDFEAVAVDDGSDDGSAERLDEWASRDPRVIVLHRERSGLVETLNAGLQRCSAPWVARMDADDVCHPRRLELQAAELEEQPWIDAVSSWVRHFPRHRVGEGFRVYEAWLNSLTSPEEIARERFVESPVAHPSVMVRRERLEDVGGYHDRDWPEDFDLWLRLLERGASISKIESYLHFWREHGDRLTRIDSRYSVENFLRCKAHYLLSGPLAKCSKIVIWGAGQTGRRLSKHLLRGSAPIEAFVDIDPSKIGSTLRGLPILPPDELLGTVDNDSVVLAAVGSRGARELIRQRLRTLGLREGREFWCVA
jgi:glycosyltransferase involved in cell wall biosynthesis